MRAGTASSTASIAFRSSDVDRARTEGETEGFAKLVTDRAGALLGAAIVGADAGELIAECVLAIGKRMKVDEHFGSDSCLSDAFADHAARRGRASRRRGKGGTTAVDSPAFRTRRHVTASLGQSSAGRLACRRSAGSCRDTHCPPHRVDVTSGMPSPSSPRACNPALSSLT